MVFAANRWRGVLVRNHWALAVMLAGLLGLIEGALSAPGSDKGEIGRWTYWTILFSMPSLGLAASLGIPRALAHLPFVIVVQDWMSLIAQGKNPRSETWYEAVFGENVLTVHTAYLPNFYYIGFLASLLVNVMIDYLRPPPNRLVTFSVVERRSRRHVAGVAVVMGQGVVGGSTRPPPPP